MDNKYETLSKKLLHEAFMLIVLDYIALVLTIVNHTYTCMYQRKCTITPK